MRTEASKQNLSDNLNPKPEVNIGNDATANRALVSKVVKYYSSLLRDYFSRKLNSGEDVEDYLQELYYRVLTHKHPSNIKSIQKHVLAIAVNMIRNYSRRVEYSDELETISIDEMNSQETNHLASSNLEKAVEGMQDIVQVERVIDRLPSDYKTAFMLSRIQGLTQKEISLSMGITISMVEKYVMATRKSLHEAVNNY